MVDIGKQISYWRTGAEEDWVVARELVSRGRMRHGLFFAHLAVEKTLKALVCRATHDLAPRIHNLIRLAEKARVTLSEEHTDLLAELNEFSIEGRYPHATLPPLSSADAKELLERVEGVLQCLNNQF